MSDITELLERLKKVDPGTARKMDDTPFDCGVGMDSDLGRDIIAGEIQRAIQARGWRWYVEYDPGESPAYIAATHDWQQGADTPAAAILAAYVAAMEAMG